MLKRANQPKNYRYSESTGRFSNCVSMVDLEEVCRTPKSSSGIFSMVLAIEHSKIEIFPIFESSTNKTNVK